MIEKSSIDFPMPREKYLSSWKIFRAISNENEITANHILSLNSWENIYSVLDLGCGDGLITKSIVLNSKYYIEEVILIDPDKEMLDEAYLHLSEIRIVERIVKQEATFESCFKIYVAQADIVIAVHLVYLITSDSFMYLLNELPVGKRLIIVLDDEASVFTKLWEMTAPKYVERSNFVRKTIDNLNNAFTVNKSVITSTLPNPLTEREDIRNALLSLLSYSDYSQMDKDTKKYVEDCVQQNVIESVIYCKSACYEIIKSS